MLHQFELDFPQKGLENLLTCAVDKLMYLGIEINDKQIDHVCYRVETVQEYLSIKSILLKHGILLTESMIQGRPISTIYLNTPINFRNWVIPCVELPYPKENSYYASGWEHLEIVISEQEQRSCMNSASDLREFMRKYPDINFDTKAINKEVNADISIKISDNTSIKFHCMPLNEVCQFEKSHDLIIPVPIDFFPH